ncbi:pyrroline-5-carboxylate reductase dimerization domain-containing protein [Effusibacillus dendaii]|uniref:Pyrroline-5-carboxylate reductase n=1 Tax=Effusibacillus dendaii TaxID=2743772 RepID=A0A7I8DDB9_9BACL|nr:pyrroline-5-carboxylate reductase dimerization domain-containing protein [Effusibacillus dendaii]BCJ86949.1 pyrroline-5-carboxylate reductase [Effusibacillus dendaii]
MRLGFVGTGSMGGMLIRAFARVNLPQTEIVAFNRTAAKLDQLIYQNPSVKKIDSLPALAQSSDLIFLCVKQGDIQHVIDQILPHLTPEQILVSINSVWTLSKLESLTPCKVIKIIPSLTQEALSGVILTMYGSRITSDDREQFEAICQQISHPMQISESDIRISSDLTSCGPAFIAYFLQSFANAAVRQGQIGQKQAEEFIRYMVYGTGKLLVEEKYDFAEIISRICVPGGVTAAGIEAMEPLLDGVFDRIFIATKERQNHHAQQN